MQYIYCNKQVRLQQVLQSFRSNWKDQIDLDISEQPDDNHSNRLVLPGKRGEFDLNGEEQQYNDQIN
jgi:hypothetical protein